MTMRRARLVTITYGDGDVEQYENVDVQDNLSSRLGQPESRYIALHASTEARIGPRSPGWTPPPPEMSP